EVKEHNVEHLKIHPSRIEVIPRGRAKNEFLPERLELREKLTSELNIDKDSIIVIHVGRQEYAKGHLNLLKSIKARDKEFSELNVKFILCGREGKASQELRHYLERWPIESDIFWLGHRNDVNEILAAGDV